jgi:hypothetical protein
MMPSSRVEFAGRSSDQVRSLAVRLVVSIARKAMRCDAMRCDVDASSEQSCGTCSRDMEFVQDARRADVENTLSGKMRLKGKDVGSGEKWGV